MKRFTAFIKYLIVLLAIGAAGWYWYEQNSELPEPVKPPKPAVVLTKPLFGSLQRTITIGGHIEADKTVTVLPRVSGQIEKLYVDEGDAVMKGDVIAELDAEAIMLQLQQAEAAFRSAKSSYERVERLYRSGGATAQEVEEVRSRYEAANSQYGLARLQLEYASVKAPMSGVILKKHQNEGSLAAPELPLFTIADLNTLIVKSSVPERYYDRFMDEADAIQAAVSRPAGAVSYRSDRGDASVFGYDSQNTDKNADADTAPNASFSSAAEKNDELEGFEAEIISVSPFISAESRNFSVTVKLEENVPNSHHSQLNKKNTLKSEVPGLLRPGMYVEVTFVLEEKADVYSLPFTVLTTGNTLWYVKSLDGNEGTAESMTVDISSANDSRFIIPEAYRDTLFISEGQHFLQQGQLVQILDGDDEGLSSDSSTERNSEQNATESFSKAEEGSP
ncbi:MAG: efflux RND transporter periplasmic adaptor subunit [Spirochaetales bacterium]|nr:efflux RND transporter periplasmic adaptor subunit [Spirochaetales bacterium]